MAIYEKMINEAVGATKAVFSVIKEKRGGSSRFEIRQKRDSSG